MNLHAVISNEDSTFDADALYAQVIAVPRRRQIQPATHLLGDLVDPAPGLVDPKSVFASDYHVAGRHLSLCEETSGALYAIDRPDPLICRSSGHYSPRLSAA